jgi:alpha-L-fucosidase
VLEEMIAYGQRVISFTIEAFDGSQYQNVFTGTTIGHKKIASFAKQETDKLRITINHAKAAPVLRNISAYLVKE